MQATDTVTAGERVTNDWDETGEVLRVGARLFAMRLDRTREVAVCRRDGVRPLEVVCWYGPACTLDRVLASVE